ncbi:hypothetical protein [Acerihabitans arboris]|uniref:Uncharacterized protein n=1 Tax=Acerihabitans arboris TaxID=2691583 RepID=A0A845SIQ7_9GAMM|nr:hypothetical protein [Acerihabitans arboris]NDL62528.1 hypothetical protein [Acerihabitans arboris]
MKRSLFLIPLAFIILSSSGCSYLSGTPGDKPSTSSPKIVTPSGQKQFWNNPGLFGAVPKNLQDEGNSSCARDGNGKAIGYHPHPKKYDGSYFSGAGYLCSMI